MKFKLIAVMLLCLTVFTSCMSDTAVRENLNESLKAEEELTETTTITEVTTTTTEAPIDDKTKIERKVYSYVREYTSTTVDKVTVNDDFGTDVDGDYIVLVYLTWDVKNTGKTSKEMLDLYSSDMAANMYNDLPSVQELCIFWTVPYLNDGQAKISFERKSNGMVYTDTVFDYNFD